MFGAYYCIDEPISSIVSGRLQIFLPKVYGIFDLVTIIIAKLNYLNSNYYRIKEPSFVTLKKLEVLEGIATKISSKEIINEIR